MAISPIADCIEDLAKGRMVILVDDPDRENEGDLTIAAEKITPEIVNFMAKLGRGLICMPMTAERLERIYPEYDAFRRFRRELDPKGMFLNQHLTPLFA